MAGSGSRERALFGVLAVLLLAVFPLAFHTYASVTRFKFHAMLLLTGVCAVTSAAAFPLWRPAFSPKSLPRALILAWLGWTALSAFLGSWAGHEQDGMRVTLLGALRYEGLVSQTAYAILFLVFSLHRADEDVVCGGVAASLAAYAALVACQYAGINVLDLFPAGRSVRSNYEFQGTIGNIDMVSGYLTLAVPLLMVRWAAEAGHPPFYPLCALLGVLLEACMEVQSGQLAMLALALLLAALGLRRPACAPRCALGLSGMALMQAVRAALTLPWLDGTEELGVAFPPACGAFLAAALALLALSRFLARHPLPALSVRALSAGAAILLALAVCLVWAVPLGPGDGAAGEMHEILRGRGKDAFGSWRLGVYRMTLDMSRENLLWGTGPDTFYLAFRDYLAGTGQSVPETFDNPHNMYLALLANTGLPSLALFLMALLCILPGALRRGGAWGLGLGAAVILYSIQGFFSFSICLVSPMFFTVLGMAAQAGEKPVEATE